MSTVNLSTSFNMSGPHLRTCKNATRRHLVRANERIKFHVDTRSVQDAQAECSERLETPRPVTPRDDQYPGYWHWHYCAASVLGIGHYYVDNKKSKNAQAQTSTLARQQATKRRYANARTGSDHCPQQQISKCPATWRTSLFIGKALLFASNQSVY